LLRFGAAGNTPLKPTLSENGLSRCRETPAPHGSQTVVAAEARLRTPFHCAQTTPDLSRPKRSYFGCASLWTGHFGIAWPPFGRKVIRARETGLVTVNLSMKPMTMPSEKSDTGISAVCFQPEIFQALRPHQDLGCALLQSQATAWRPFGGSVRAVE